MVEEAEGARAAALASHPAAADGGGGGDESAGGAGGRGLALLCEDVAAYRRGRAEDAADATPRRPANSTRFCL